MGKTKTEMRPLMCRLSEDELEQQGKALTDLLQEKAELEIQKSASNRHYSDAIKAVDVKIEKQIPIVRDREIEREVEVRTEYNVPDTGKKRETRLDTLEIIFEGQMTDSECQDLFINTEDEPPEDENAQGQKLLPAPVDAEEVIRFDIYGEDDGKEEILMNGNFYEVNGKLYKAIPAYDCCKGCAFDNGDVNCHCDCIANSVILTPADIQTGEVVGIGDGEDQDEAGDVDMTDLPDGDYDPAKFCSKCGSQQNVYHIDREKPLCNRCLEQKNQKNLAKVETALAEKRRVLVRPSFGYGCSSEVADCTCFRFTIYDNDAKKLYASWGSPVYLPGDYRTEGTDAANYYKKLLAQGVEEG